MYLLEEQRASTHPKLVLGFNLGKISARDAEKFLATVNDNVFADDYESYSKETDFGYCAKGRFDGAGCEDEISVHWYKDAPDKIVISRDDEEFPPAFSNWVID